MMTEMISIEVVVDDDVDFVTEYHYLDQSFVARILFFSCKDYTQQILKHRKTWTL
jgi:hypothetical protein